MSISISRHTYTVSQRSDFERGATTFDVRSKPAAQARSTAIDRVKILVQAGVIALTSATTPCVLSDRRFVFPETSSSTVSFFSTLPVRKRITLGEARRRSLETMVIAEARREQVRNEEAHRWQWLDRVL